MVGLVHSPIYAMLPNVRLNVMECADAAEFSWCRMLVGICSSYNAAQRYNAATIASLSHTVEVMQTLQLLQLATMLRLATAVWLMHRSCVSSLCAVYNVVSHRQPKGRNYSTSQTTQFGGSRKPFSRWEMTQKCAYSLTGSSWSYTKSNKL